MKSITTIIIFISFISSVYAQDENKIKLTSGEGIVIAGYVNDGGFLNFTGPSIKLIHKPYLVVLGCLPSMRIKEDKVPEGAKKNAIITPSLGFGITFAYKHLAIQLPSYYNTKTATANGKWNLGLGLGYKF
jgi:hypothetical protein